MSYFSYGSLVVKGNFSSITSADSTNINKSISITMGTGLYRDISLFINVNIFFE